jgi:trehalose-6-phosphate synthase
MPAAEQRERMRRMRAAVRERNVYRWAAELIDDLSRIRVAGPAPADAGDPAAPASGPPSGPAAVMEAGS